MLDDDLNIVLSDFGLAIRLHPNQMNQGRAGTPCYYPYEMVAG
jgi:serine/threonine protein kinase